ncbi:RsmB/NOP family class I SAM-dependent RNA methyltransferase [Cochlodiniinecator piscidefendens]|uniref:RsmB/NOP family class I SAM-dependent RNA methyltransferase n=1 Tax=Cochlodiniinecator piscidefendens TaxID=2715756 RepID=UPI0014096A87|nr:transcription antitermination factor NusB [Cochlodiniinecator piscidefendens]
MSQTGLAPRKAAVDMLNAVLEEGKLLSEVPTAKLSVPEAARAQRLAVETLRWMGRADRLLGRYLRKMPPVPVMNILRLGVYEICQEGEASHGVVNSAVELVHKGKKTGHLKGLVNATLRKVATDGPGLWPTLAVPELPKWLRKPLIADYTKPVIKDMEQVFMNGAPLDLTPKDGNAEALAVRLGGEVLSSGSVRLQSPGQVSKLPGFVEGDWWVQDAAAAMPVKLLAPKEGESVLDMCAAPGGKTMQMAAAGAKVTALDQSERRMQRVAENLKRTGLSANLVVGDALEHIGVGYDAILLDAPCTATGTIRRHPDLPYAKDGSDFPYLFELQERMIDHALSLLNPGGRLVFCTCSLLPDEGEIQIEDAMKRHGDLQILAPDAPWIEETWKSGEGGLRLRPDYWGEIGGMDGFYMAHLSRS